jgi:hypothetical protein
VIPSDNRAVGQGNPPQDANQLSDMEGLLAAVLAQLAGFPGGSTIPTNNAANVTAVQTILGTYTGIGLAPSGGDDALNVQALINLGVKTVWLQAGTFSGVTTVTSSAPPTYINGAGRWATTWNYTGTGDAFRLYTTSNYSGGGGGPAGGGIKGMTIDGTGCGAGSAGIHAGDIYNLDWDCGVRHFQGTGSKAFWFDNKYAGNGCEQMHGRIWAETSTTHVLFDVNPAAGYAPAGSFDRTHLDIFIDGKGKGDLVVLNNGAYIVNGDVGIFGNTDYGSSKFWCLKLTGPATYTFTATNASPCVFTASGSSFTNGTPVSLLGSVPTGFTAGTSYFIVGASGTTFQLSATYGGAAINSTSTGSGTVFNSANANYSAITNSTLRAGIECNGTSGTQPGTIDFVSQQNNVITGCTGILDFSGNNPFAAASNIIGSFQFDGPVYGDGTLQSAGPLGMYPFKYTGSGAAGVLANGDKITTRYNGMVEVTTSGNVTGILMQGFPPDNWRTVSVMNNGTGTITMAASGSSGVANGVSCVIAANSAAAFIWNNDLALWYPTS